MIKAILFDLDGTLINTPELIIESFKEAVNKNTEGYTLTEYEITNVLGQTLTKAFARFSSDADHLNEMIKTFREFSLNHKSFKLETYEGLIELLDEIKSKGLLTGIVTSKNKEVAFNNLSELGLTNYFDCIITHDDSSVHKPNPEPILIALDRLKISSNEAIYIGDHENDIIAGKNANVKTGLMGYSYRLNEATKHNPNYIFNNLLEIKKIV